MSGVALLGGCKGGLERLRLGVGVHGCRGGAILRAQLRRLLEGVCLDGRRRGTSIPYATTRGVVVLGARHLRGSGRRRLMV